LALISPLISPLIFGAGVIAGADASTFPSDGCTVCVGDLICPSEVAAVEEGSPAVQSSGGVAFASRPRYWSVESLSPADAAPRPEIPESLTLGPRAISACAALCGIAAASLIWAKYGK
jgi:hypothetical protein